MANTQRNYNQPKKSIGCGGWLLRLFLILAAIALISAWQDNSLKKKRTSGGSGTSSGSVSTAQKPTPSVNILKKEPTPTTQTPAIPKQDPSAVQTDRNWNAVMPLPTMSEIEEFNRNRTPYSPRSPYIGGWMQADMYDGYVEYSLEFKSDFLPPGTYCCGANFYLDYPVLRESYADVHTDYNGVSGYAGLQYSPEGTTNAIMTIWDEYCIDNSGNQTVVKAKLIYPENESAMNNKDMQEGNFVHYLPPFQWSAGRWYRMTLRCTEIPDSDHTGIEMRITDLTTTAETLICKYDLGVPNVYFKGNNAFFLECFDPTHAGEIRTMECRNVQVVDLGGISHRLTDCYMSQSYDYPGSYKYGSDGNTFYMITTGIPDKVDHLQEPEWFSIE